MCRAGWNALTAVQYRVAYFPFGIYDSLVHLPEVPVVQDTSRNASLHALVTALAEQLVVVVAESAALRVHLVQLETAARAAVVLLAQHRRKAKFQCEIFRLASESVLFGAVGHVEDELLLRWRPHARASQANASSVHGVVLVGRHWDLSRDRQELKGTEIARERRQKCCNLLIGL